MIDEGKRNEARLSRMIESGEALEYYSREGRSAFFNDPKTNHTIRDLLKDFTEEADKLAHAPRRKDRRVDWEELAELRRRVHHQYYRLSNRDIWEFIESDLDRYRSHLRRIRIGD